MARIPPKIKARLATLKRMTKCIFLLRDPKHKCEGRIEREHVWIYAGRQIQEVWAIVSVCTGWHRLKNFGSPLEKDWHRYVSLTLASDDDLKKYPRFNWKQEKQRLAHKYENTL